MDKPDFSFRGYHFESATLDFANVSNKLDVRIDPSGEFVSKEKTFYLKLQANYKPILLPTMNLSSLNEELKNNTVSR